MNTILLKFLKFCGVGATGLVIDFGITYICKERLKFNKYASNSLGFMFAATTNYILNRIWTFESENQNIYNEYFSFMLICVIGLIINNFAIWIIHEKYNLNFYLSKITAIVITTIWNFVANYTITFKLEL